MAKLSKREIRKEARALMKGGMSKQEAYEELVKKHRYYIEIADTIENVPHPSAKKKYGAWNVLLLVLLCIVTLLNFFGGNLVGAVLDLLLIRFVAGYFIHRYVWLIVFGALGLIGTLFISIVNYEGLVLILTLVFGSLIPILMIIFGIMLPKKLCPAPDVKRETYLNKEGQKRAKDVYLFADV